MSARWLVSCVHIHFGCPSIPKSLGFSDFLFCPVDHHKEFGYSEQVCDFSVRGVQVWHFWFMHYLRSGMGHKRRQCWEYLICSRAHMFYLAWWFFFFRVGSAIRRFIERTLGALAVAGASLPMNLANTTCPQQRASILLRYSPTNPGRGPAPSDLPGIKSRIVFYKK